MTFLPLDDYWVMLLIELNFYGTDLRYIFRYRFHSALTELAILSKVPLHPVVPQKHLNNFLNRCNEANYPSVIWTIYLSVQTTERSRPGGGRACAGAVDSRPRACRHVAALAVTLRRNAGFRHRAARGLSPYFDIHRLQG